MKVHRMVEEEVENGTDPLKIVLGGFSQVTFNLSDNLLNLLVLFKALQPIFMFTSLPLHVNVSTRARPWPCTLS